MKEQALELTKARLGITSTVRDFYLEKIIEGVIEELQDVNGLSLDEDNPYHLMFVVDYADWRYSNRDAEGGMPRHLQFRLHNLIIQNFGGGQNGEG